jgi:hypothetical protein
MTITAITFRRDGLATSNSYEDMNPAVKVTFARIVLSTSPLTGVTMSKYFAANHGSNQTTVVSKTTYNFPAVPPPRACPADFGTYNFPFASRPFLHTGKGPLCVETQVSSISTASTKAYVAWPLDVEEVYATGDYGVHSDVGQDGCTATGQTFGATVTQYVYPHLMQRQAYWRWYWSGMYLPPGAQPIVFLGTNAKAWGSALLPYSLAMWLGTGCFLYTNPVIFMVSTMKATSTGAITDANHTVINPTAHLLGVNLYLQALALDSQRQTPIQAVTSRASRCRFPKTPPRTTGFPAGSLLMDFSATSLEGLVFDGVTHPVKITY